MKSLHIYIFHYSKFPKVVQFRSSTGQRTTTMFTNKGVLLGFVVSRLYTRASYILFSSCLLSNVICTRRCGDYKMDKRKFSKSQSTKMFNFDWSYRNRHDNWNTKRSLRYIFYLPCNLGKTSFAKSLPGQFCYFKGRWSLDSWNDQARYLIFDDIPWDKFEERNFPSKKDLLSANGLVSVR